MTIKITGKQAIKLLDAVVEEQGGDTKAMCAYTRRGKPVCLVGHALYKAGVLIEGLEGLDTLTDGSLVEISDEQLADIAGVKLTKKARHVFEDAQATQDNNQPWGEAVEVARMALK